VLLAAYKLIATPEGTGSFFCDAVMQYCCMLYAVMLYEPSNIAGEFNIINPARLTIL
jgi:hypothetical protein